MKREDRVKLRAGKNIAMKVPAHEYEATVHFYRDIIGLLPVEGKATATVFKFGDKHLWVDKASQLSQSEGFQGFWISGPNDIIHLISET